MEEFIENSNILRKYVKCSEAELKLIRMYIQHNLIVIKPFSKEQAEKNEFEYAAIKACLNEKYNFLVSMANCKYSVDSRKNQ